VAKIAQSQSGRRFFRCGDVQVSSGIFLAHFTGKAVDSGDFAHLDYLPVDVPIGDSELPANEPLQLQHFGDFLFGEQINLEIEVATVVGALTHPVLLD